MKHQHGLRHGAPGDALHRMRTSGCAPMRHGARAMAQAPDVPAACRAAAMAAMLAAILATAPAGAAEPVAAGSAVGSRGAGESGNQAAHRSAAEPVTAGSAAASFAGEFGNQARHRTANQAAVQDSSTAAGATAIGGTARPQLTPQQAAQFQYREVLKYVGVAGGEKIDPWDPLADPLATGASFTPNYVVDAGAPADGVHTFNTVQAAVSRALADSGQRGRAYILVKPGVYRELVYVPPSGAAITLYGEGKAAGDTVITAKLDAAVPVEAYAAQYGAQFAHAHADVQAMYALVKERAAANKDGAIGTGGSMTVWVRNNGFQARNLTIANGYNKDVGNAREECGERPCGNSDVNPQQHVVHHQAVALQVEGADKAQFENVRLLGFQDTLYLKNLDVHQRRRDSVRSFFHKVYIEGDVDFIFGDSTAYFLQSEIRSLGDRSTSYVGAPNTSYQSKYGFVFDQSSFTHDGSKNALAGQFFLARQWFHNQKCTPYGKVSVPGYRCVVGDVNVYNAPHGVITPNVLETVGKMVVMNSRIGRHINAAHPWSDWNRNGTLPYRPAQFDSNDYWANLKAAGIDPVKDLGYSHAPQPAMPFLAEYNNTYEP
jgi:pectinesterase